MQHHGDALLRGELRRRLRAGVDGGAAVAVQQAAGLLVRVPHRIVQAVADGAAKGDGNEGVRFTEPLTNV